jgi:lauroyl/myristoyl acyltransferase
LHQQHQIIALADVSADRVAASLPVDILGRRALMPRGLLRVAAKMQIPVTVYLNGIRMSDGQRTLEIIPLGTRTDADALTTEVFRILDRAIRADPAAWHFWPIAHNVFAEDAAIE